jgi:DNA repair ATPase RecN
LNLEQRLRKVAESVAGLEAQREDRLNRLNALQTEMGTLNREIDLNAQAEQVLQHVSSKVLGQSVATIDKLVSVGLKLVFDDLNLEFKTEVDRSRGKTSIKFKLLENGHEAPILSSYGGGPLVLCGVLLRVVTIIILGLDRTLLLDESLSHVSAEYHVTASHFLNKICQELDFTIVMVTHQPLFAEHATRHYEARRRADGPTYFHEVKKPTP